MVASTDIKFYVHSNNNAPQLQNAYGSMIGVLDACLVNGVSLGPVSTLTAVGTIVTAVFSTAHNLMQYQVLKIAGAIQAEYNGEYRILTVPNATSVTFELGSAPSATTATGTITASLPPLGWEKPFSSTNEAGGGKAAYRSKNVLLPSRPFLRVVDELDPAYPATYAKYAKVGIVEDMTDINTMLGVQAPYDSASPDKNWVGTGSGINAINGWAKWYYTLGTEFYLSTNEAISPVEGERPYILVGDSEYFYILPSTIPSGSYVATYGFGAFDSLLNTDNANTFLSATLIRMVAGQNQPRTRFTGLHTSNNSDSATLVQRSYNSANYVAATTMSLGVASGQVQTGYMNYIGGASFADVAPYAPVFLNESVLRGVLKGYYWLFQERPYRNLTIIEKNDSAYLAVNASTGQGASGYQGQIVVKVGDL